MNSKLHIGTSGWSYKDWLGPFYPPAIKQTDYLKFYSKTYSTVEIDSTFYAIPRASSLENWFNKTPDNFIFSLKAPKLITHEKQLENCQEDWDRFIETAGLLKHKLGVIVLQFDYKFTAPAFYEKLKIFLEQQRHPVKLAVEIRHRSWHNQDFYNLLQNNNVALVLNDLYYLPRIIQLTTDFTYIRLLGNRKLIKDAFKQVQIDRSKDLDWWQAKIRSFLDKELEVFVYTNNHYQGYSPATADSLLEHFES